MLKAANRVGVGSYMVTFRIIYDRFRIIYGRCRIIYGRCRIIYGYV